MGNVAPFLPSSAPFIGHPSSVGLHQLVGEVLAILVAACGAAEVHGERILSLQNSYINHFPVLHESREIDYSNY
jgi:hypothetical protein